MEHFALPIMPLGGTVSASRNSTALVFNEAIEAGVDGFVLKDNAVTDIQAALKAVAAGDAYLSPVVSNFLLRRNRRVQVLRQERPGLGELTPMEGSKSDFNEVSKFSFRFTFVPEERYQLLGIERLLSTPENVIDF